MTNEITTLMMKMKKYCFGHVVLIGILLSFFVIIPTTLCEDDVTESHVSPKDKSSTTISNILLKPQDDNVKSNNEILDKSVKTPDNVKTQSNNSTVNAAKEKNVVKEKDHTDGSELPNPKLNHTPELDSGAVVRAFYVFVGLSVIVMAYLVFRSFRLRSSPAQMVRKYGVLAHKQDIEMRPLPLDDDDDDDTTVFDASKLHSNQTA